MRKQQGIPSLYQLAGNEGDLSMVVTTYIVEHVAHHHSRTLISAKAFLRGTAVEGLAAFHNLLRGLMFVCNIAEGSDGCTRRGRTKVVIIARPGRPMCHGCLLSAVCCF